MKKNKYVLLAILITIIFSIPFFSDSLFQGHDTTFHINRIVGCADAFRDGQIIPRLYPYSNNGYGYISPTTLYCDIFVYPFAILYILGLPIVLCYKLMIISYIFLGVILTLMILKKMNVNIKYFSVFMILYCFNPYRFINVFIRGAFGELLAYTFFPLVFYFCYKIFVKNHYCFI